MAAQQPGRRAAAVVRIGDEASARAVAADVEARAEAPATTQARRELEIEAVVAQSLSEAYAQRSKADDASDKRSRIPIPTERTFARSGAGAADAGDVSFAASGLHAIAMTSTSRKPRAA